jgi:hypothetical protein
VLSCREHFFHKFEHQLFNAEQERQLVDRLLQLAKRMQQQLHEGAVAVQHLHCYLVNLACTDAGCSIVQEVMLPVLRKQVDAAAAAAASKAMAASSSKAAGLLPEKSSSSQVRFRQTAGCLLQGYTLHAGHHSCCC